MTPTHPPTLRDPDLDAQLREQGFVVVDDVLSEDVLDRIMRIAERVYVDDRSGFHASNLSGAHEYRHAVNREVSPIVGEAAGVLFADYEPFFSSFVVKWVDGDTSFPSHQDWNMVDEDRHRSMNVFVPLVDMDASNGALRVLPGSHRALEHVRCSPMPPEGCESVGWTVTPDEMDVVALRRGQVLVFDHALLHCSAPNTTDAPRWAAITAFKPRGAELFHWFVPDPQRYELEVFRVDSDFFADFDIGGRPEGEPVRTEPFIRQELTKDELLARCGRPVVRADVAEVATSTSTEEPVVGSPEVTAGSVQADADLDRHLDERGWVVIDLFRSDELERLRQAHRELDHDIVLGRSFAAGFHATVVDDRAEYRRASHRAIESVVAGPCARHLVGMQLAFTNWVHKEPGAAAAPKHVDWNFVDEPEHRSLSVWAPLVDTDERTGCIGVLDRSHLAVDFVRAAAHPGYDESHEWFDTWPDALLVPLRAGQALVYDHRTVHFSQPHLGDEPRVAVTCEFVPWEADLLHFEQVGSGRFLRHTVSPEFFVTYVAGQDPRSVPGHLSVEEVERTSFDQVAGPSVAADGRPSSESSGSRADESAEPPQRTERVLVAEAPVPATRSRSTGNLLRRLRSRLRRV